MDRDEILEKGRKDNRLHDEGALDAHQKGRRVGVAGFMVLIAVVIIYNAAIGISISLPLVFLLGYLTCQAWGQYVARRETVVLVTGVVGSVGLVIALAGYVLSTLL
ncbi:DUF6442 family protein [uncultured Bifidobacterium sp.]|uniref:DUF6442 family protein n=1 Tax=uncultured Bifidobacterium sp. TaxID=165187 RepID=UPI00259206D8|nr:DUF6442 family protein [uncultured Bifidobacterium sp.]